MNTPSIAARCKLWIAAAATSLLAACGGGVDVSVGGTIPDGPSAGSVTDAQAFKVTSASIASGPMSLLVPANVMLSAMEGLRSVNGYKTTTLDISAACTAAGGSLLFSVTDADNSATFTSGDLVSMAFTNCGASNDGVSLILNGALDLTVSTVVRATDTVVSMRFTPRNLSATVRGVAATFNGSITIEYVIRNSDGAVLSTAYVTNLLEITFAGGQRTDRVSDVRWGYVDDVAAGVVRLSPNQNVTLFENGFTTAFSVTTVTPFAFRNSDGLLAAGQLTVLHPADTVRVLVTGLNRLEIAIDYNSGGRFDHFLNIAALDLLNGWN
ncbi:MAG: hypothetical protein ACRCV9_01670 [Burkholderiaceae bacterium]